MKKKLLVYFIPVLITAALCLSFAFNSSIQDFYRYSVAAVSYYGSRGQQVIDIQTKLSNWGYYDGAVDGIFGYKTYQAVRLFQQRNGLKVDGIVGDQTLAALGLPTGRGGASTAQRTPPNRDTNLLAHIISGEARGEPYTGQVAVGAVVLNRVRDSRFPNTIAGVVYQPGAFDAVADGQINLPPTESAFRAARDSLNGWDPSDGAVYYYNPVTATNRWIRTRPIIRQIGKHVFAR